MGTKKILFNALMMAAMLGAEEQYYIRKRTVSSPRQVVPTKLPHRVLRIFYIKGMKIEAYSKKDAIKRYNHQYKNK